MALALTALLKDGFDINNLEDMSIVEENEDEELANRNM